MNRVLKVLNIGALVVTIPSTAIGVAFVAGNPQTTINWFNGESPDQKISTAWADFIQAKNELDLAYDLVEEYKQGHILDVESLAKAKNDLKVMQERLNQSLIEIETITSDKNQIVAQLQGEIAKISSDLDTAKIELDIYKIQHSEDVAAIEQKESQISSLQFSLNQKQQELDEVQQSLSSLENEMIILRSQIQTLQVSYNQVLEEISHLLWQNEPLSFTQEQVSLLCSLCKADGSAPSSIYDYIIKDGKMSLLLKVQYAYSFDITLAIFPFNYSEVTEQNIVDAVVDASNNSLLEKYFTAAPKSYLGYSNPMNFPYEKISCDYISLSASQKYFNTSMPICFGQLRFTYRFEKTDSGCYFYYRAFAFVNGLYAFSDEYCSGLDWEGFSDLGRDFPRFLAVLADGLDID